jgi:glycosyltransferase involved in cell wall biosynthesis
MKPRILMVTQNFPPERFGNASRMHDLSKNLVKLGAGVTVLSPHPTFPFGSFKRKWKLYSHRAIDGIKNINIFAWQPTNSSPSFMSRMGYYLTFPLHAVLWALIKRKEYDVIITTAPPIFTGITGYFVKKITGKKWFLDVRDLWIDASISLGFIKKNSFFGKFSRKYEAFWYGICDEITVTTEEIKNSIIGTYAISPGKIEVISNGVDTKAFKPLNVKKNRIIYSGLLGTAQDLEKVILAVKKINEKIPLEFYLVGDGDTRKDLEELVKKESLEDKVIFTGLLAREELPGLIAESCIGITPLKKLQSLQYAIPTKAYEYMSCGIPFVGTGEGEIEHLAEKSKAGLVADTSVNSIYEKIMYLLENEKLREEMGQNGRAFVEKYNDREKIAEKLLHSIEKVVA